MDYTKIPRSLIYKEKSRDEFLKMSVLNKYLFEGMFEAYYHTEYDAETKMVQALNDSYYLMTIILLDDTPYYRLAEFREYSSDSSPIGFKKPLPALPILVLLMDRFGLNVQEKYAKLYDKLKFSYALDPGHPIRMLVTQYVPSNDGLSLDNFAPREIDEDAILDFNQDENWNWRDLTNDYDEGHIQQLLKAVRNTEEGDMLIVREIMKDVEAFCDDSRKAKKLRMLSELEDSIYWHYNAEYDDAIFQAQIAEQEKEQERIKRMEEENKMLKQRLTQMQDGGSLDAHQANTDTNEPKEKDDEAEKLRARIRKLDNKVKEALEEKQRQQQEYEQKLIDEQRKSQKLEKKVKELQEQASTSQGLTTVEAMTIELFTYLFKEDAEETARAFYDDIWGKDDPGIASIVAAYEDKFGKRVRNCDIYRPMHAAKIYQGIDRNFDTALRKLKFRDPSK